MQSLEILHLIERSTTLRTAASLTRTVTHLISSGEIPPNSQLPTIRVVAEQLGMSRSAVGQTWRGPQKQGLVESRRRGGTAVLTSPTPPRARTHPHRRARPCARSDASEQPVTHDPRRRGTTGHEQVSGGTNVARASETGAGREPTPRRHRRTSLAETAPRSAL